MKKQKWTEEDKRNFHEQKLRASTIPPNRDRGPLPEEWEVHPEGDEPTC
jgi:hypothetical protein